MQISAKNGTMHINGKEVLTVVFTNGETMRFPCDDAKWCRSANHNCGTYRNVCRQYSKKINKKAPPRLKTRAGQNQPILPKKTLQCKTLRVGLHKFHLKGDLNNGKQIGFFARVACSYVPYANILTFTGISNCCRIVVGKPRKGQRQPITRKRIKPIDILCPCIDG